MGVLIKKEYIWVLFLIVTHVFSVPVKRSVCITIPKTGTNLLHKCFASFDRADLIIPFYWVRNDPPGMDVVTKNYPGVPPFHHRGDCFPEFFGSLPGGFMDWLSSDSINRFSTHFPYIQQFADKISSNDFANFLTIRDPRDQVVSYAFMVYKYREDMQVPFEQVLLDLIDGKKRCFVPWGVALNDAHALAWELGVVDFYKRYLPFTNLNNVHVIRFEDLVGEPGGGSKEKQINAILMIAQHLSMDISSKKAEEIAQKLFGGTFTFREGQIGSWKKHFSLKIKQAFKDTPGALDMLIALGYEKDSNW